MRTRGLLLISLFVLVGCATPGKPRFHTLSYHLAAPAGSQSAAAVAAYRVAIGPATVPEAIDRPQMVLDVAPGRHAILDGENWSAPLKREIPRVLAEVVGRKLAEARVAAYSQHGGQDADFKVLIDVQRFESIPGTSVSVEALWSVHNRDGKRLREVRSVVVERVSAPGIAPLVEAHSKALAALGGEIAEAVAVLAARK